MTDPEIPALDLTDEPVVAEAMTASEFIAYERPHLLQQHSGFERRTFNETATTYGNG
jgi:hypothetical protein